MSTEDHKLHAVIAIGGFARLSARSASSLPLDDLQLTSDNDDPQVRIAMTGEQLQALVESRPEFRLRAAGGAGPARLRGG